MEESSTSSLCSAPWGHTHITPDGNVHPCCHYKESLGNINQTKFTDIYNNDKFKDLRKQFLQNKKPTGCQKCYTAEDNGYVSFRHRINNSYWGEEVLANADTLTLPDGSLDEVNIFDADFRFSNKCNMACVMCSPTWSSKWASEMKVKTKYLQTFENNFEFIKNNLNKVQLVNFAGGEPLIMDEHWQILDMCVTRGRVVKLAYTTNCSTTTYKNMDIIEYLKDWKARVIINCSIDSIKDKAEYIRYGIKWNEIENTLKKYKQLSLENNKVEIVILSSIGMYNVFGLKELFDHMIELGFPKTQLHLNPVAGEYSIANLPAHAKKDAYQYMESLSETYGSIRNFKTVQNICLSDTNEITVSKAIEEILRLDKNRNLNFFKTFPELKEYYKNY